MNIMNLTNFLCLLVLYMALSVSISEPHIEWSPLYPQSRYSPFDLRILFLHLPVSPCLVDLLVVCSFGNGRQKRTQGVPMMPGYLIKSHAYVGNFQYVGQDLS